MKLVRVDAILGPTHRAVGGGLVAAIGNFDGLHLGHQALFSAARALARAEGAPCQAGVVTFDPHPVRVLSPTLAPPLMWREDEKLAGLERAGLDAAIILAFTPVLASLTATEFCERVLKAALGVTGVVVGEGFRFGKKAAGGVADLAAAFGERVVVVPPVRHAGHVCSSSKVRELVLQGHVEGARLLLGRPYDVEGVVVRGDGRGRTIGIPTANVESGRELMPKVGVYATRARLPDGRVVDAVTNVGLRPTFAGEGVRVEAHLLDVSVDLYGKRLQLDLVARLRDERRFGGPTELVEQIRADIAAARAALATE